MYRVLVLGSSGMLGHMVYLNLVDLPQVKLFSVSFKDKISDTTILCDVTNLVNLARIIRDIKPDVIVNCIGVLIKGSKSSPSNAVLINSYLPHWLVDELDKYGGRLIHVSTDCVFSGSKGLYVEEDFRDADDVYGRTKALGEINTAPHLTLRTSIVGPELKLKGEGLFHWFMNQSGNVNGYKNAFWGGVTTLQLAKVINQIVSSKIQGLVHVTNGEPISKYELLALIKDQFGLDRVSLVPLEGKQVNKSLKSNRLDVNCLVPSYADMISELQVWMQSHKSIYNYSWNEK
jgi:dTDP-4-dehydrorhamnose reductase